MQTNEREYEDLSGVPAEIDRLCDQFERSRRCGKTARIEEFLVRVPAAARGRLLQELLLLEWDYCQTANVAWSIGDYRRRFAADLAAVDRASALYSKSGRELGTLPPAPDASPSPAWHYVEEPTTQPLAKSPTAHESGRVLGDYVLLDEIGAGGMGRVYKARHRRMNRVVAIKLMSQAAMRDESAVKRFQRETEAAARLEHPNVVTAYDAGSVGDVHYLVMQFVDGIDLSALVKAQGPLPVDQAIDCVRQAAQGLAFAHAQGIIHRDIKPANLLRARDGVVKVLDLGLARFYADEGALTASEQMMGTVDYMSPEQAADTKSADARSDVYSLGCTLWYLLTGRRLYDGDTGITRLLAHREAPVPSLTSARADCSAAIEQVLKKMIAKRPEDRYATMTDVIAALQSLTTGAAPIPSRRTPSPESPGRRRLLVVAGAVALCGMAAVAAPRLLRDRSAPAVGSSSRSEASLTAPAPAVAPFDGDQAKRHQQAWAAHLHTEVETANSLGMRMVLIPPGEFLMGSTEEQIEAAIAMSISSSFPVAVKAEIDQSCQAELPRHRVVLTRPYLMSATEVTVGQFRKFMEAAKYLTTAEKPSYNRAEPLTTIWSNPGYAITDDSPVTWVCFEDATAFCLWLSREEGVVNRLPTEAEWEFACRAGTTTQFFCGDDERTLDGYAWFNANTISLHVRSVATKLPNPFGLYDMHGNVIELCRDWFDAAWYARSPTNDPAGPINGKGVVFRGGGSTYPILLRSAYRKFAGPMNPSTCGFRVVRELDLPQSP